MKAAARKAELQCRQEALKKKAALEKRALEVEREIKMLEIDTKIEVEDAKLATYEKLDCDNPSQSSSESDRMKHSMKIVKDWLNNDKNTPGLNNTNLLLHDPVPDTGLPPPIQHSENTGQHASPLQLKVNIDEHELSSPLQSKEHHELSSLLQSKEHRELSSLLQSKEHRELSLPLQSKEYRELSSQLQSKEHRELSSPLQSKEHRELSSPLQSKKHRELSSPLQSKEHRELSSPYKCKVLTQKAASSEEDLTKKAEVKLQEIHRKSPILNLDPILQNGFLKVGSRLSAAAIPEHSKHLILPRNHRVSEDVHIQSNHQGRNHVLAVLREKYWILGDSMKNQTVDEEMHCVYKTTL